MANPEHLAVVKRGATAIAEWRRTHEGMQLDLRRADLRAADLRAADLRAADLRAADLWGARLEAADLSGAHLEAADLRGTRLEGARLEGADLRGARLERAALGQTRVLQLGPLGPHRVYLQAMTHPDWLEEQVRLGCERGTLAELEALALARYGTEWTQHYGAAFAYVKQWLKGEAHG